MNLQCQISGLFFFFFFTILDVAFGKIKLGHGDKVLPGTIVQGLGIGSFF